MTDARVWLEAWKASVVAKVATGTQAAADWADACVEAFRLRYRKPRGARPPEGSAKTGKSGKR